jgi:hypothetical protein
MWRGPIQDVIVYVGAEGRNRISQPFITRSEIAYFYATASVITFCGSRKTKL